MAQVTEMQLIDRELASPLLSHGMERGGPGSDADFVEQFIEMKAGSPGGACAAHVSDRILSAAQFWHALTPAMAKVERAVVRRCSCVEDALSTHMFCFAH